jgi:hypothetical protein
LYDYPYEYTWVETPRTTLILFTGSDVLKVGVDGTVLKTSIVDEAHADVATAVAAADTAFAADADFVLAP